MAMGIASIALPLIAICVNVVATFLLPPLGICSLIFVVAGLVVGIMAWTMGAGDLKKIRAGEIDRSAESGTKTGYITGIIGTILNAAYFACGCIMIIVTVAIGGAIFAALFHGMRAAAVTSHHAAPPPPAKRTSWAPIPNVADYLPDRGRPIKTDGD
jgi:hypothetical protein